MSVPSGIGGAMCSATVDGDVDNEAADCARGLRLDVPDGFLVAGFFFPGVVAGCAASAGPVVGPTLAAVSADEASFAVAALVADGFAVPVFAAGCFAGVFLAGVTGVFFACVDGDDFFAAGFLAVGFPTPGASSGEAAGIVVAAPGSSNSWSLEAAGGVLVARGDRGARGAAFFGVGLVGALAAESIEWPDAASVDADPAPDSTGFGALSL